MGERSKLTASMLRRLAFICMKAALVIFDATVTGDTDMAGGGLLAATEVAVVAVASCKTGMTGVGSAVEGSLEVVELLSATLFESEADPF